MADTPLPRSSERPPPQRSPDLDDATGSLYDALRLIAGRHVAAQAKGSALEPTELVHECFLRLAKASQFEFKSRAEFLALASKVLRQVLIDHARFDGRQKRGQDWNRVTLHDLDVAAPTLEVDLIELNDALNALAALDVQQARIVELRFLGGLELAEIAKLLELPLATVEGDWTAARAWLRRELKR